MSDVGDIEDDSAKLTTNLQRYGWSSIHVSKRRLMDQLFFVVSPDDDNDEVRMLLERHSQWKELHEELFHDIIVWHARSMAQ